MGMSNATCLATAFGVEGASCGVCVGVSRHCRLEEEEATQLLLILLMSYEEEDTYTSKVEHLLVRILTIQGQLVGDFRACILQKKPSVLNVGRIHPVKPCFGVTPPPLPPGVTPPPPPPPPPPPLPPPLTYSLVSGIKNVINFCYFSFYTSTPTELNLTFVDCSIINWGT